MANRRVEHAKVRIAGDAVQNYAGKTQPRVERLEPSNHGGNAARAVPGVHNQNDGQVQQLGNFGCTAFLRTASHTVEKPHHSFDYSHVAACGSAEENLSIGFCIEHPGIEVAHRAARNNRKMAAIDEIRTPLEGLHGQTSGPQCRDDCDSNRRLAHTAGRARHYECIHGRTSTVPLSARGSPATMSNTLSAALATR